MSVFRNFLMQTFGWLGKPADWSDIRKDCPANSIALYAAHKDDFSQYDNLGFTATCTGGYNVFIDEKKYGTFTSGSQCSITWSKYNQNLPYGYTQLEYLQSSGTQYLDLGIKGNGTTKVEIKYRYNTNTSANGSGRVFGSRTSSTNNAFAVGTSSGVAASTGNKAFWCYDAQDFYIINDVTFPIDEWQTIVFSATEHTLNGVSYGDDYTVSTFETPQNLKLFGFDNNGTVGVGYVDIEYCKLWDNGELVRNLIPCKNSSNVLGMYDTVNDVFYENEGTDDFAGGNEVYPIVTTGDIITTPSLLKAHKIWIEPATEGNNITAFHCDRVASSGSEEQGILWEHFNVNGYINISNLNATGSFGSQDYKNILLTACTSKNNKLNVSTSLASAFFFCENLEYLPTFNGNNNSINLGYFGFAGCQKIKKIDIKNLKFNEGSYAFYDNYSLEVFPKDIDYSSAEYMQHYLTYAKDIKPFVLDVSAANSLKVIHCYGNYYRFMLGFKGLRVSNQAPFDGTSPQIDVSYTGMDRAALVTLFNDLPTVNAGQIINITGCTGSEDLLPEDVAIATNKGWTVTGGPAFRTYYAYTDNSNDSVYTLDNPINGPVFNQPNLTANGTMGGDTCAVESDIAQYPDATVAVYKGFDGNTGTLFHSAGTTVGYFTYYSPTPICVTKITFTNQGANNSRASASGTIYGSNDNTNWTTITTYTNSSTSAVWDIDLSSNTNYYKYYKLYSNGATDGGSFWVFKECKFTATQQPSNLYNSSLQLLSPQPAFDANKQGLNGLVTGSLTNNDGIYSGFNSANYLSCDNFLNNTQNSFEVKSAVYLTSNVGGDCCIVDTIQTNAKTAFRFEITTENKIRCRLSNDTTSSFTYFLTMLSNTVLDLNTWYYVKVTYDSTTGYALYVTQDENNWGEPEVTSAITSMINQTQQELRLGYNVASGPAVPGYIDATKTCFTVDGKNNNLYYLQDSITINNSGVYIDYARNSANDKQGL